jgi:hypothetical protein
MDRRSPGLARYGWLAAAASLVFVAGMFYVLNRTPGVFAPPPAVAPQIVDRAAPPALPPSPAWPPQPDASIPRQAIRPPRVDTVRASRSAPRIAAPEVIVPPNQMEAVRRLVRAVNEGRVELPAQPVQGPLAAPTTLDVAPLVVEPIPVPPLDSVAGNTGPSIRGLK